MKTLSAIMRTTHCPRVSVVVFSILFLCLPAVLSQGGEAQAGNAQAQPQKPATQGPEGREFGDFAVHQSVEFGVRFADITGNPSTYNTYLNLHTGPRVLEQSLSLRSINNQGFLVDDLLVSSFGWGGDPYNAARLRASKHKWYNFNYSFRRDQNYFDYNLLANPLNPLLTTGASRPITFSPHRFETRRRMQDANLTLAPQAPVRLRLGYTRNRNEGPSFSSFHNDFGTDQFLFQAWNTTLNAYQIGVDFKLLPRTNISYDQFLQYYKGDTTWTGPTAVLDPNAFRLPNGQLVDLGLPWAPNVGQPCGSATPPAVAIQPLVAGVANPSCNGMTSDQRLQPIRASYPTEQISLQSRYFRRMDIAARFSYNDGVAKVRNFLDAFSGMATAPLNPLVGPARTGTANRQAFTIAGPTRSERVAVNGDLGITIHLTDRLRFTDSFRFQRFNAPGTGVLTTTSLFASTLPGNMLLPPCPAAAAGCAVYGLRSPADISTTSISRFLGQNARWNLSELEFDITKNVGVRAGYRYGRRSVTHRFTETTQNVFAPGRVVASPCLNPDETLQADLSCVLEDADTTRMDEHSLVAGAWVKSLHGFRFNFDTELMSADGKLKTIEGDTLDLMLTRITPRNRQWYKGRLGYAPKPWLNLIGTVNVLESRNNQPSISHREHYRTYGFNAMVNPSERFGIELGYDFNDLASTTNICFVVPATGVPRQIAGATALCEGGAPAGGGNLPLFQSPSTYDNTTHFGFVNFVVRPVKRVALGLGYSILSASGTALTLNPNQPLATLDYDYHRPLGSVSFDITNDLTFKAAYAYYGYHEKSFLGLAPDRDFHANTPVISLRYAF